MEQQRGQRVRHSGQIGPQHHADIAAYLLQLPMPQRDQRGVIPHNTASNVSRPAGTPRGSMIIPANMGSGMVSTDAASEPTNHGVARLGEPLLQNHDAHGNSKAFNAVFGLRNTGDGVGYGVVYREAREPTQARFTASGLSDPRTIRDAANSKGALLGQLIERPPEAASQFQFQQRPGGYAQHHRNSNDSVMYSTPMMSQHIATPTDVDVNGRRPTSSSDGGITLSGRIVPQSRRRIEEIFDIYANFGGHHRGSGRSYQPNASRTPPTSLEEGEVHRSMEVANGRPSPSYERHPGISLQRDALLKELCRAQDVQRGYQELLRREPEQALPQPMLRNPNFGPGIVVPHQFKRRRSGAVVCIPTEAQAQFMPPPPQQPVAPPASIAHQPSNNPYEPSRPASVQVPTEPNNSRKRVANVALLPSLVSILTASRPHPVFRFVPIIPPAASPAVAGTTASPSPLSSPPPPNSVKTTPKASTQENPAPNNSASMQKPTTKSTSEPTGKPAKPSDRKPTRGPTLVPGTSYLCPSDLTRSCMQQLHKRPSVRFLRSLKNAADCRRFVVTTAMIGSLFQDIETVMAPSTNSTATVVVGMNGCAPRRSSRMTQDNQGQQHASKTLADTESFPSRTTAAPAAKNEKKFAVPISIVAEGKVWVVQYKGIYTQRGTWGATLDSGWRHMLRKLGAVPGDDVLMERWTEDRSLIHLTLSRAGSR